MSADYVGNVTKCWRINVFRGLPPHPQETAMFVIAPTFELAELAFKKRHPECSGANFPAEWKGTIPDSINGVKPEVIIADPPGWKGC